MTFENHLTTATLFGTNSKFRPMRSYHAQHHHERSFGLRPCGAVDHWMLLSPFQFWPD